MTEFNIKNVKDSDLEIILQIFNYYVKNGFAAYPEEDVSIEFFNKIKQSAILFYILEIKNNIRGFAFLRNYLPYHNFQHTAILSYFILPDYTDKGYGTILLNKLLDDAREKGINDFIVNLSSLNKKSLTFHKKHGFKECGRFKKISQKFNKYFDIVWMRKTL